jgi:hypothetical protein
MLSHIFGQLLNQTIERLSRCHDQLGEILEQYGSIQALEPSDLKALIFHRRQSYLIVTNMLWLLVGLGHMTENREYSRRLT